MGDILSGTTLLEMKHIHKKFPGVYALKDINFELRTGEVHALLGENGAGKSTLIKVLGGIYTADEGEIIINGKKVNIDGVKAAQANGVAIIHQELVLVPYMTVAENIFLGREPMSSGFVDKKKMNHDAQKLLDDYQMGIQANQLIKELTIAQQQMVEIVKAISYNSKILVMDEPTSSISDKEVAFLFKTMRSLTSKGVGIIYISHKMSELEEICDKSIDISDNNIYGVSKTSKKALNKLDKKVTFKIYAEKDSTDTRIKSFIKKYTALSDKISVKWIDPVLHPAALTKAGVDKNTIVISCKDTGKTKSVSFDDILVSDSYSYYTTGSSSASEFDGEGQFTSAINSVTSEQTEKIYYTTGHGEATFSDSVTKLFSKNNLTTDEVNLMMTGKIPDDCDLLFMDAPSKDISDDEKTLLLNYLKKGGKVFIILGDSEDETPNLDEVLKEYGMQEADGYIADMQRSYQGNYYYIFPEITATDDLANNLESEMVLMINAHGLITIDPARDTITTTAFMQTSDNSYAVTEDKQEEGTYTLGAVATEQITSDDSSDSSSSKDSSSDATKTSRLTVISSESMIDSQITDTYTTLENLDLFMNAVTANFDKTKNVAIKAKSLEVSNNTMQHAGIISILTIFGIPLVILIYGFMRWWKRRKA